MQFLGYALSAFGPNYITWIFLERMFRRKNIPIHYITNTVCISGSSELTGYSYFDLFACLLLSGGLDAPIICIRSISGLWCNK